jgi:hypothetical protein
MTETAHVQQLRTAVAGKFYFGARGRARTRCPESDRRVGDRRAEDLAVEPRLSGRGGDGRSDRDPSASRPSQKTRVIGHCHIGKVETILRARPNG